MNAYDALVDIGYTPQQAQKLLPSLFMYLFKGFHQKTLKERAARLDPDVPLFQLLAKIPLMGSITQYDKICISAEHRGISPGIQPESYIRYVLGNPEFYSHIRKFKGAAYTVAEARRLEERALLNPEIALYVRKFLYRKMSFIMKNYGVLVEDLTETVQERAIHNLRMNYPNWNSAGEMMAMSKSAIANAGHNIIKFYAATKRARLDVNNRALEVSLDNMLDAAGDAFEYTAMVYSDLFEQGLAKTESNLDFAALLDKTRNPTRRLFLSLLGGRYDYGFSEYLGQDNADFSVVEEFDSVFNKACDYIGVPKQKATQFLESLR